MGKDVRRYRLFDAPQDVRRYYETGGVGLDLYVVWGPDGDDVCAILPYRPGGPLVELGLLGLTAGGRVVACRRAGGVVSLALLETSPDAEGPVWVDVELVLSTPEADDDDERERPGALAAVTALAAAGGMLFLGYAVWGVVWRWLGRS